MITRRLQFVLAYASVIMLTSCNYGDSPSGGTQRSIQQPSGGVAASANDVAPLTDQQIKLYLEETLIEGEQAVSLRIVNMTDAVLIVPNRAVIKSIIVFEAASSDRFYQLFAGNVPKGSGGIGFGQGTTTVDYLPEHLDGHGAISVYFLISEIAATPEPNEFWHLRATLTIAKRENAKAAEWFGEVQSDWIHITPGS